MHLQYSVPFQIKHYLQSLKQLDLVFNVVKKMGEFGVRRNLCMGIESILGDELSPKDWSNASPTLVMKMENCLYLYIYTRLKKH